MPHDSFVKGSLSNIEVAKDLLKPHIPSDMVERIDWDTFQLTNKSYVDNALVQTHSDLVYKCLLKGKEEECVYIYLHLEHKSTPDKLLPFWNLKYNVSLMQQHLDEGHTELPIIINICLYAGSVSPYPYSMDIYDCFRDADLAREKMFKPSRLIDTTVLSQEQLEAYGQADLVTILLKQAVKRKFLTWVKENNELIIKLLRRAYAIKALMYILAIESEDLEGLKKEIIRIDITKKDIIMTAADKIRNEWLEEGVGIGMEKGVGIGMEKGRKEGREEGVLTKAIAVAKNMLLKFNLDIETVQKVTELPKAELEKILQGSR